MSKSGPADDEPRNGAAPWHPVERAIDAAANRAREGLRVVEDFTRFVAPDDSVARSARDLRHRVTSLVALLAPPDALLAERDVEHDAGASPVAFAPRGRASAEDVLRSAFKRSQEALRSLAEFSRLVAPKVADSFERARYELYSLEKRALVPGSAARRAQGLRLIAVVDSAAAHPGPIERARLALEAGADCIALAPAGADRNVLALARAIREVAGRASAPLLIKGRADIGRLAGADGVVLGAGDLPAAEAARLLGPSAMLCREASDADEALAAEREGASSVILIHPGGVGSSASAELVGQVAPALRCPVFAWCAAADTLDGLLAAGARRLVVRAPEDAARELVPVRRRLDAAREPGREPAT